MDPNRQADSPSQACDDAVCDPDAMWTALLALYAEPGVTQSCLRLQDELGCDVLLVLLAVLLARAERRLTVEQLVQLRSISMAWQAEVVGPLRTLRRDWRVSEQQGTAVYTHCEDGQAAPLTGLRRQLAQLELAAEREEWVQLLRVLRTASPSSSAVCSAARTGNGSEECLGFNLRQVLGAVDANHKPLLEVFRKVPAR